MSRDRASCRIGTILSSSLCWHKHRCLSHVWLRFTIDLHRFRHTVVLSLVFGGKTSNSMLFVAFECTVITISVGIYIFAFACTFAIDIITIVLVSIGVDSVALTVVVTGRVASFAIFVGELIGSSAFFLSHWYMKFQIFILDNVDHSNERSLFHSSYYWLWGD